MKKIIFITLTSVFITGCLFTSLGREDSCTLPVVPPISIYSDNSENKEQELDSYLKINVLTQEKFYSLQTIIEKAVYSGVKNIRVNLAPGTFYFKEKALRFYGDDWETISIEIHGYNTLLIPYGKDYENMDVFPSDCSDDMSFICGDDVLLHRTEFMISDGLVEVVDSLSGLCRIKRAGKDNYTCLTDSKLIMTQWYWTKEYQVEKSDDLYLYFTAVDLRYLSEYGGYNVNYDFYVGKRYPRYAMINVKERPYYFSGGKIHLNGINGIHQCSASAFIAMSNSRFSSFKVEGVTFLGNKTGDGLIQIDRTTFSYMFKVSSCRFIGIKSFIIQCVNSGNVCFERNYIYELYGYGFYSDHLTYNIAVTNNHFEKCGLDLDFNHCQCVKMSGERFLVANNTFVDYGVNAISTGNTPSDNAICAGVIEKNIISFSDGCYYAPELFCSMDNGAIYLGMCNENITVRYNLIYNINGYGENRGIFCDDGTAGVRLIGNVIFNIKNSYCIDIRRVESSDKIFPRANTDNVVQFNFWGGDFRFEGKNGNDGNINGVNYVLKNDMTEHLLMTNEWTESDSVIFLENCIFENGKVKVPRKYKKLLEECPVYKEIRDYFVTIK